MLIPIILGGLPYLAEESPGVLTYFPKGYAMKIPGIKSFSVAETMELGGGFAIVGPLKNSISEQSLAVSIEGLGFVLAVGCSHQGVLKIAMKAFNEIKEDPFLLIGGFHMMDASREEVLEAVEGLTALGFKKVAPLHCSGDEIRRLLSEERTELYVDAKAGSIIDCITFL